MKPEESPNHPSLIADIQCICFALLFLKIKLLPLDTDVILACLSKGLTTKNFTDEMRPFAPPPASRGKIEQGMR